MSDLVSVPLKPQTEYLSFGETRVYYNYHLPCSLCFSVGDWFCEGALHHPHWLWIEFLYYSGQKDLLWLMYGDLECDCCISPPCHSQVSSLYFKSDNKQIKSNKIKIFKSIPTHIHKYITSFFT